jgi:hypothetical protein
LRLDSPKQARMSSGLPVDNRTAHEERIIAAARACVRWRGSCSHCPLGHRHYAGGPSGDLPPSTAPRGSARPPWPCTGHTMPPSGFPTASSM